MYEVFGLDPKKDKEVIRAYNNVFTSGDGPVVLRHMLIELGFFDQDALSETERVRQDYAKRILMLMGIWNKRNISNIVNAILKNPIILPETNKENQDNAEGV